MDNLLVEIVALLNELITRFVYLNGHNITDKLIKFNTVLGELQVDQQYVRDLTILDQVMCTTVKSVESETKAAQVDGRRRNGASGKLEVEGI